MAVIELGRLMAANSRHPLNTFAPMMVIEPDILTSVKALQPEKVSLFNDVNFAGSVTDVSAEH